LPGDYGFDPLGISSKDLFVWGATNKNREPGAVLSDYRDAELRHGRLAMLAALGWPVQELVSPALARYFNREAGLPGLADILTATDGRSPSVLNGGLDQTTVPLFMAAVALAIGALDQASLRIRADKSAACELYGPGFIPGDFGFDPLRILSKAEPEVVRDMQAKEVNNGRLAMVAITCFALEEFFTGIPIIKLTPQFFTPLFEWDGALRFLDSNFAVASEAQRISGDAVANFVENIPK
jgi:hypothetical protein